jgi:hypothetical protein
LYFICILLVFYFIGQIQNTGRLYKQKNPPTKEHVAYWTRRTAGQANLKYVLGQRSAKKPKESQHKTVCSNFQCCNRTRNEKNSSQERIRKRPNEFQNWQKSARAITGQIEKRELDGAWWWSQLKRDKPTLSYTILNAQRVFQTTYNLAQAKTLNQQGDAYVFRVYKNLENSNDPD